jgi:YD repeat-containing protein
VQQADSTRVSFTYDSAGRLTQREDPLGHATSIVYDSAERVGTNTYNSDSEPLTYTDGNGHTTS